MIRMLAYVICFLRVIKSSKVKEKGLQNVFIMVLDEIAGLVPTYPRVQ